MMLSAASNTPVAPRIFRIGFGSVASLYLPALLVLASFSALHVLVPASTPDHGLSWFAPFLLLVAVLTSGLWRARRTYVIVDATGLRIRSGFGPARRSEHFAWSEISDAVGMARRAWPRGAIEVRAGSRVAWIHYPMLADLSGLIAAVRQFGGDNSPVLRALLGVWTNGRSVRSQPELLQKSS